MKAIDFANRNKKAESANNGSGQKMSAADFASRGSYTDDTINKYREQAAENRKKQVEDALNRLKQEEKKRKSELQSRSALSLSEQRTGQNPNTVGDTFFKDRLSEMNAKDKLVYLAKTGNLPQGNQTIKSSDARYVDAAYVNNPGYLSPAQKQRHQDAINQKNAQVQQEQIDDAVEFAQKHPVAAEVMKQGAGIVGSPLSIIGSLQGKDASSPIYTMSRRADAYGQGQKETIENALGTTDETLFTVPVLNAKVSGNDLVGFGVDTISSMIQSALGRNIGVGLGKVLTPNNVDSIRKIASGVTQSIMSASAYSSAYSDAISRGASNDQAVKLATANGIAEWFFEKYSVERLLKDKAVYSLKDAAVNVLKQAGTEGSEEIGTEFANAISDYIIMQDNSNIELSKKQYMSQGMTEEEASAQAVKDVIFSGISSFLGGAISGATMGSMDSAKRYHYVQSEGKNSTIKTADDVKAIRESVDLDRESFRNGASIDEEALGNAQEFVKFAESVEEKLKNGGELTREDVNRLEAGQSDIPESALERGTPSIEENKTEETQEETKKYGMNVALSVASDLDENGKNAIANVLSSVEDSNKGNVAVAFQKVYDVGRYNMTSRQDYAYAYAESKGMTADQISYAFKAGQADYKAEMTAAMKENPVSGGAGASVFNSNFDGEVKKYLSGVGGKIRATIEVDASMGKNEGAKWNGTTRTLTINPNADDVVGSLWHDITHVIQDSAPSDYSEFRDYVVGYLASREGIENETFLDNMIAKYQTRYESHTGKKMTRSEVIDEIVSDAAMEFSTDEKAVKEFVKEHRTVAEKIVRFFEDVIDALNSFFGRSKGNEVSNKLKEDMDAWVKARDLWYKALKATNESKQMVDRSAKTEKINEGFIADERNSLSDSDSDKKIPRSAHEQRDKGYKLNEKKFYQFYSVHKLDIGNRFGDINKQIDSIKKNGFKTGTALSNIMPSKLNYVIAGENTYKTILEMEEKGNLKKGSAEEYKKNFKDQFGVEFGSVQYSNVVEKAYAPKKGEYVIFVPENYVEQNQRVKTGFKPFDYEIAQVEYDNQPYYELYSKTYDLVKSGNKKPTSSDDMMYGTGKDGKIDYSYYAEQTSVRPEFNMTNIRKMMNEYTGDGSKLPVAKGIVDEFVGLKERGEKFSLSVDDYIEEKSQEYTREEQKALIESMRDSVNVQYGDRTLPAYYEGLRKANDAVSQYLRRTHYVPEKSEIRKVAKAMKAETESTKSVDEISEKLTSLYEYINNDKFVDGDTVSNTAKDIAEWMLGDQTEYYDETEVEHYKELKDAIKAHTILVEDEYLADLDKYDGLKGLRKYFGTLKVSRTKGRTADSVIESIREEVPGLIPDEVSKYNLSNPADALDYLIERLETEKPKPRMRDVDYDAWTYNVGQMIYDAYFDTEFVPGDQTGQELLAEYRKGLKEFQSESRNEQKYKDRVAAMRKRWAKYKENEDTRATKNAIMKSARRLTTMLKNPTNTKHVPESFRVPLANFLSNIYYGTSNVTSQRTVEWSNMMTVVNEIINNPDSTYNENGTSVFLTVDPDLGNKMKSLTASIDKVVDLDQMSKKELRTLKEVFVSISKMIETADQMMADARKRKVSYFGDGTIDDLIRYKNGKVFPNIIGTLKNLTANQMLDAYTRFHTFGTHAEEVLKNIENGFAQKVKYLKDAEKYVKSAKEDAGITDKEIEAWKADETITVGNVEMTVGQVMSLYELMKRKQARKHVMEGGFTPASFTKNGSLVATTTNGNVRLTTSEISEAIGKLTDKQKKFADMLTRYFQVCAEWGNKTTLAIYGYAKFKDPNYFPIKSDPTPRGADSKEVLQQGQTGTQTTLKGVSAAQNLTPDANNPIMLENILDVFTNHVDTMASYGSLLIPLDDAQKWIGYKMTDNSKVNYRSTVRGSIQNVYGNEAVSYVLKLIKDMNGTGIKGDGYMFGSFTSKMKGAAVGFNLSVAIQQPTSYVRAVAVMDEKYLTKALASTKKADYDLIEKYSYIAQWKDWGFRDINVGKSMQSILIGSTSKMDKMRDASMWLAEQGDKITWGRLWLAAEYQVRDENRNLEVGTEEYYKEVANVFNNVVNRTQVVDSTLNRSNIMRSDNTMMKEITAFMGEHIKSYNMLYRAAFDYATQKDAKNGLVKAGVAFVLSAAASAIAKSVITAARRGGADRDDDYFDRYMKLLSEELIGNLNPVGMIPYVKDVAEMTENIIKGEEIELPDRSDMAYMKDIAYVVQRWVKTIEGKYTVKSSLMYTTRLVGALTGVAAYGIVRDADAVIDTLLEAAGMDKVEYWKLKQERPIDGNVDLYVGVAMRYYAEGNTKLADQIINDIVDAGIDETDVNKKIKNQFAKKSDSAGNAFEKSENDSVRLKALEGMYDAVKGDAKKKTEVIEVINGMEITDEAKEMLFESKYSSKSLDAWKEYGGKTIDYMTNNITMSADAINKLKEWGVDVNTFLEYYNGKQINFSDVKSHPFDSFAKLKKEIGSASKGDNWHHIVEQNKTEFSNQAIHNSNNVVSLASGSNTIHSIMTTYYGSKPDFTGGKTVSEWLRGKSFKEQWEFGVKTLQKYGVLVPGKDCWVFIANEDLKDDLEELKEE